MQRSGRERVLAMVAQSRPPAEPGRSCLASDFVVLVLSEAVLSEAVLSETVLVLDGCSNCGNSDRGSKRFAGTCGPMGRIAILGLFEYESEYRDTEYEYEKKHEQSIGPKRSIGLF